MIDKGLVLSLLLCSSFGFVLGVKWENSSHPKDEDFSEIQHISSQQSAFMVDDITRFDNVKFNDAKINFNYTLMGSSRAEIDIFQFNKVVYPQVVLRACSQPLTKYYLTNGRDITYQYIDREGHFISHLIVSGTDCLSI